MTLRTRLLLGYALLVLVLVATGVAGSFGFREISILVNERLNHFTVTTKSANTLLRSVERQDRLLLQSLISPEGRTYDEELETIHKEFLDALRSAERLADAEQRPLLARIREGEAAFTAARHSALADGPMDQRVRVYQEEFLPVFDALREPCAALFGASRDHMFAARDAVRDAATGGSILLGALVTVGLLLLVALARSMRTHVLERLDELRRFSEAIASGEEHQRALVSGNDELAHLAMQMNAMLDRQAKLEGRLEGRLAQDREFLVGMLGAFAQGALLLSTGGDLITWTGGLPDPSVLDELAVRAAARNRAVARGESPPNEPLDWTGPDGSKWRIHLLRAGEGRPAGWLAEPAEPRG